MTKMIVITILVFIGTIAAGIGVGMLVLNYTNKSAPTAPVVEVQASPTPVPTVEPTAAPASGSAGATSSAKPTATPKASPTATTTASASSTLAKQKILVVNATDKAGYAGQIKDVLTKAGIKSVTAGNAKGKYTATSDITYQKKADDATLSALEKASGLSLTSDDSAKQEDPQGSYDIVIVLNQK